MRSLPGKLQLHDTSYVLPAASIYELPSICGHGERAAAGFKLVVLEVAEGVDVDEIEL